RSRHSRIEGEGIMRSTVSSCAIVFFGLIGIVIAPAVARAADPDWKAVEQALGKSGQLQPGDVFRVGMPRTDLAVTVKGVPVKAGFALGSYAAFKQMGDRAMVMGDLVLLDLEVPAVMSGLIGGGVYQITVPRAEAITGMGQPLLPAMGVVTVMNFQPTADGKAAITGDFVLIDKEVNAVAKTLRQHGIDVTALHNHGLMDTPRLFYMHFWANDDPAKLAQGLKAA